MNPKTEPPVGQATAVGRGRKPWFSLALATGLGVGFVPGAPGTWGSLLGVAWSALNVYVANINSRIAPPPANGHWTDRGPEANFLANQLTCVLIISALGLVAATRFSRYLRAKDPQIIVIDEVSGQMISYLGILSAGPILHSWKYLLLGFILFRVFDIWKPFPSRRAEDLRGGWGIMADDWIAGIYAAIFLWLARLAGF